MHDLARGRAVVPARHNCSHARAVVVGEVHVRAQLGERAAPGVLGTNIGMGYAYYSKLSELETQVRDAVGGSRVDASAQGSSGGGSKTPSARSKTQPTVTVAGAGSEVVLADIHALGEQRAASDSVGGTWPPPVAPSIGTKPSCVSLLSTTGQWFHFHCICFLRW